MNNITRNSLIWLKKSIKTCRRIQNGDCNIAPNSFTLPDVYGNEQTIERGSAGVFGKKFYNYIIDKPDLGIKFINMGDEQFIKLLKRRTQNMSNKIIRRTIRKYIKRYGRQDTRTVIAKFATAFHTTKQRISGNISCMKCIDGTIDIIPNKPHSIMY